ncbi:MAG: hypothetical protein ACRDUX_32935 [Mycobacterium sp.]
MTDPAPWWATDPVLEEIRRRTAEEFGLGLEGGEPVAPDGPDPVMSEILDGTCWRELAEARDGLARARERYDASVLRARTAGFSWGEIGGVLGVSRQQLHRRFSTRQQGRP